ncbi:hypothetical protein KFU94_22975 [Chloroflexi bacterium TSY]|nr:hypothetical protein [Chloroflexi bacterium TSY]
MSKPTNLTTPTTLFTIRLWCETYNDNRFEWRGKITNLHNQEVRYFRDAETLYGVIVKMVHGAPRRGEESIPLIDFFHET